MGCHYYSVEVPLPWTSARPDEPMAREEEFYFPEGDDSAECLCTFPFNDGESLSPDRLRSIAYLGAAHVLARKGVIRGGPLPGRLPSWVREGIDRAIPLPER